MRHNSTVSSSALPAQSAETPRFTLETAAVLSLLVQRQSGGRKSASANSERRPSSAAAEMRLRNLQDFAKRLFGIQIDLGGLSADEVVGGTLFDGAALRASSAEGVSSRPAPRKAIGE